MRSMPSEIVARWLPSIALVASIVSTVALAVVLTRAFGAQLATIPSHLTVRTERGERVIARGHEQEIFRHVVHGADEEIPPEDRPSIAGIEVEGGRILVRFTDYPERRLTIHPVESADDAFLRTAVIAVAWPDADVPATIRRYVSVIAESPVWGDLWTAPEREARNEEPPTQEAADGRRWRARLPPAARSLRRTGPPSRRLTPSVDRTAHLEVRPPRDVEEHPLIKSSGSEQVQVSERSVWLIVLLALMAGNVVATVLLVAGRGESRPSAEKTAVRDWRVSPLAACVALMALGVGVLALAQFHFRIDDYSFLALATRYPFELTGETRILSTRAHYQVGVLLGGGRLWFAASNLALLGAMCATWGLLLHRIGFSRDAAVLAAALLALGPGTFFLLRQANGVEHLSATTCLLLVLLLTDLATREADRRLAWRYGVLALALCLSVLGVLMKLPLMIVLPPSCWLWGRWLVQRPLPPMHRSATYLAFFAAVYGASFMLTRTGPPLGFAPSRLAFAAIGDRLWHYGVAVGLLLALAAVSHSAATKSVTAASLRSYVGRVPLLAWAFALSALWITPFVLHAEYEGEAHYGMLASAPLSAVAALVISAAAGQLRARGWLRVAAVALVCVVLLPLGEIRAEMRRAANEHVFAWIAQIRSLTAGRPEPEQIIVAPACPAATIVPPLSRQMTEIYSEIGIWWATGWYEVPVELRDDGLASEVETGSGAVVLGYCPGQPPTIE